MPLELRGVVHNYRRGDRPVLDGVDLVVGSGETLAIVGPSGSGKTTLLSILGGLLQPTAGALVLNGRVVAVGAFAPGDVAWIFQKVSLFGSRSALDNVAIGSLAVGADHKDARQAALAALAAVGLDRRFAERRASTLSGGEAQRVGIARALVAAPRYVLADEPTGQLDVSTSRRVAQALFESRPSETAIIVATHDGNLADQCDRVARIVDGRVVESAS